MRKHFLIIFFSFFIQFSFAQNNLVWKGYFSYNEVNDLTEAPTKIIASTQKSLFSKNIATNELKTVNTIDGLSGQDISAVYYSAAFNKTIIGHANGLMLILNESDGKILIVPGIRDQAGLTPTKKKINHFYEYEGKIYISCDFGVVQYNLETLGFGDTYLIGLSGGEEKVFQTTVLNNNIYAATERSGIRRADLSNPNLNDFNQWQVFDSGFWSGIVTHNNQIAALNSSNALYRYTGSSFALVSSFPELGIDIRSHLNNLVVTTPHHVYSYDINYAQTAHIQSNQVPDQVVTFSCATLINSTFYIGTLESGILTTTLTNLAAFQIVKPDGPSRNDIFAIQNTPTNKLWAVYGGYDIFYAPNEKKYGISKLAENGWLNIPYEKTLESRSLVRITVDPANENHVFFSSFSDGLLEFKDDVAVARFTYTTPDGPESVEDSPTASYKSTRVNGAVFDKAGNLWFNNTRVKKAIKSLKPNGQWQSFSIESAVNTVIEDYGRMVIDKNGTKWFVSGQNGVIGFNENVTPKFKKAVAPDDLNVPFLVNARAVAVDNRNQLWIGTYGGLRVLSSVDRFMTDDELEPNPIIIIEDGLPQELLYEQFITDIVVDGANNKWIGTGESGVFLLSPNGQEIIHRFTRENSPLPSNSINDIEINGQSGEVFFATSAGLVSFLGTSTKANDNLQNVFVYPNPVRPEFNGTVKITGLINKANIKITDIEGNLVYETTSEGGTIEWDTKAFGKYKVASGVYMIFISSEDGVETKVKKVMIIR